ncbi:MAG: hypothetical protein QXX38_00615 [Candidatus Aenigmatarchaeota archaeon]
MRTKILILGLVVIFSAILLTSYFMLPKPSGRGGYLVLSAIPVFYSNSTITSESEALMVFNRYFNEIIQKTKEELLKHRELSEAEAIQEMNFFEDFVSVEKRGWNGDKYWLGPNKSAYVFVVPATSKYEKWEKRQEGVFVERIKCKGLGPGQIISFPVEIIQEMNYEKIKNYLDKYCPQGTEIYWKKTESEIKYLIDNDGTVYWAGQNLIIKPLLID